MVDKKMRNYDFISFQKATWDRLVRISESSKIANAYLFSGPTGSGKEGLALMFAQLLNCNSSKNEICFQCDSCIRFKNLQHEKLKIITQVHQPYFHKTLMKVRATLSLVSSTVYYIHQIVAPK